MANLKSVVVRENITITFRVISIPRFIIGNFFVGKLFKNPLMEKEFMKVILFLITPYYYWIIFKKI